MEHTKNGVPLFHENNYALWKGIMEVYLLEQGYEVWDTVQNGFTSTADEQGKNNLVNDAKAKNIIISGLIESAYHKVLGCKTTKMYGTSLRIYMQVTQMSKKQSFNSIEKNLSNSE